MLLGIAAAFLLQASNPDRIEARVDDLMTQLTLEEKVELLSGINDFYTRPIPRLHIPRFKMSDGPAGVRTWGKTTAYPAPICMAATWDRDLMLRVGESYGRDARARGVDFLLAPGVNIYRVPQNGRNFEYYGEDPYLASQTAVGFIKGVQSQGVAATVKHFAANNQEHDRTGTSSDVDERTMREIYLPTFEAAVKEANVRAVMCSYNLLNGTYASENDWLENQVLKKEWGFNGVLMSDWGATHSAANAANHGLDLEMPGGDFFTQKTLLPAVLSGEVSRSTIDDKVRRLLRVEMSIGAFDRTPPTTTPVDDPQSGAVALEVAREGIVLLKNKGNLLPLSKVTRIALVGPNSDPAVVGGGGSSQATPFHSLSVLDAIKERGGSSVIVDHAPGVVGNVIQASRSSIYDGGTLKTEIFANQTLSGQPYATRDDRRISYSWQAGPTRDMGHENFSIRWKGSITPKVTADYEFMARGDDGYRVYLDDKPIIDEWRNQAAFDSQKAVHMEAGRTYKLKVEYYQASGDAEMRFGWRVLEKNPFAKAVEAARKADVAIVCLGLNPAIEHEGDDHSFSLPAGQDDLVEAVLKVNPRTIVVLNSGCALDLTKWIDRVPALIMAWYPGQDGNKALAGILFGDLSPSGKLPISLARRWEDCASYGNYPGVNHHVKYAEGIFTGYRSFDQGKVKPLFPFGFGLSYSTFEYSGPKVEPMSAQGGVTLHFSVINTGKREADEIAQVYVAPQNPAVPRPVKELKGFVRLHLQPREMASVDVHLNPRSFSYYDVKTHDWIVQPGDYQLLIGSSSQDIRLHGRVRVQGHRARVEWQPKDTSSRAGSDQAWSPRIASRVRT